MIRKGVFLIFLLITLAVAGPLLAITKTIPDTLLKAEQSTDKELLSSEIKYHSRDSIVFETEKKIIHLYGDAEVIYENIILKAGYIMLDMNSNLVVAASIDSAGKKRNKPNLSEDDKETEADSIKYNFKTRKGWMYRVRTSEGEGYMYAMAGKKDSNDVYYIKDGKYTTCDADEPHYHIHVTKGKVIPDDKIITGPAYLVIGDIPTPLAVPFGFFPNKKGQKSGILIPAYGESPGLGFFLKDGGVYFGISDNFDIAIKGDIYSKGSYGVKTFSNYNKRYAFSGNFALGYSNFRSSYPEFPDFSNQSDFFVRWTHTQDPKKNPGVGFSANVNILSSNYYKLNSNNTNDYLSNTFQSSLAWRKSWRNSNLSTNFSHSQNTLTKKVDLGLPRVAWAVNRQYPTTWFKKGGLVKTRQIDKIGFSLQTDIENRVSVTDSNLFKPSIVDSLRYAGRISMPWSWNLSFKNFPITFTPSWNPSAILYFETTEKTFNTITDQVETVTKKEVKPAFQHSLSMNASTKWYMMYSYKRGRVKAIRHVMSPVVGFSFKPDYSDPKYGYYGQYIVPTTSSPVSYSIFQNGIYGSPAAGKSSALTFSLNNNLEMKLRAKEGDTSGVEKKVTLIESFGVSSSWNYAIKDLNLAPFAVYARTKLFNSININLLGVIDPYKITETGFRYDKFMWEDGKIGRLTSASASAGTSWSGGKKKGTKTATKKVDEDQVKYVQQHPDYYVDFNVPWTMRIDYNLVYSKPIRTETITQSISLSGDLNLTEKWKVGVNSGYDFVGKEWTHTRVSIYRDLHCWEMQFNWVPFGFLKSYTIDIRVKASVLQDLKLSRKREWYDYN